MSSDHIDRILNTIDTGLQHTDEPSYGEHTWNTSAAGDRRCIRCPTTLPDDHDGEICTACRAYLLGDTDTDPAHRPPNLQGIRSIANAGVTITDGLAALRAASERIATANRRLDATSRLYVLAPTVALAHEWLDSVGLRPSTHVTIHTTSDTLRGHELLPRDIVAAYCPDGHHLHPDLLEAAEVMGWDGHSATPGQIDAMARLEHAHRIVAAGEAAFARSLQDAYYTRSIERPDLERFASARIHVWQGTESDHPAQRAQAEQIAHDHNLDPDELHRIITTAAERLGATFATVAASFGEVLNAFRRLDEPGPVLPPLEPRDPPTGSGRIPDDWRNRRGRRRLT